MSDGRLAIRRYRRRIGKTGHNHTQNQHDFAEIQAPLIQFPDQLIELAAEWSAAF